MLEAITDDDECHIQLMILQDLLTVLNRDYIFQGLKTYF